MQNNYTLYDKKMMLKAIFLAKKGLISARPNPTVGCVIVKQNKIIGSGYHKNAGGDHAEVAAIKNTIAKGNSTNSADMYVTLEPCYHYGKTPPCYDIIIKSKIKKVFIGCIDHNPLVSHKGIAKLKNNNITVIVGLLEKECTNLNNGFFKFHKYSMPFVTYKVAISLDGKVALASGESKWISCEKSRADVQRVRAENGAILTSANTVIADNPFLTVRDIKCADVLRVVLDPKNQINDKTLNIFNNDAKTFIFNKDNTPVKNGHFDLKLVLKELAKKDIFDVLIEVGANLASEFLRLGLIDKIIIYQAPIILGGDAKGIFSNISIDKMANKINFITQEYKKIDSDIKITLRPK